MCNGRRWVVKSAFSRADADSTDWNFSAFGKTQLLPTPRHQTPRRHADSSDPGPSRPLLHPCRPRKHGRPPSSSPLLSPHPRPPRLRQPSRGAHRSPRPERCAHLPFSGVSETSMDGSILTEDENLIRLNAVLCLVAKELFVSSLMVKKII